MTREEQNRVKAQRLIALATLLKEVPKAQFDMRTWEQEDASSVRRCAAGWAAVWPEFQNSGFRLKRTPGGRSTPLFHTTARIYTGFEACAKFFGLSTAAALDLFGDGSAHAPSVIIYKINELLKSR